MRTRALACDDMNGTRATTASDSHIVWIQNDSAQDDGQFQVKEWRGNEVLSERAAVTKKALIVGLQGRVCAVPLAYVIETMRPLPIEPLPGVPSFVQGVAIIRGIPTPVISLGAVLGTSDEVAERFVTVRAGDKQVAVSVNEVLGVCDLDTIMIHKLPPLLQGAAKEIVEMIGTLDEQVLMILGAGWELPDEVWRVLPPQEMAS